jgi:hypothetical protein
VNITLFGGSIKATAAFHDNSVFISELCISSHFIIDPGVVYNIPIFLNETTPGAIKYEKQVHFCSSGLWRDSVDVSGLSSNASNK